MKDKRRNVLLLANGSISVCGDNGRYSFFSLRKIANWFMNHPNNIINQLAIHCQENQRLILNGPGTDFAVDENGSMVKSIAAALLDGHIGNHGINANLEKMQQFIQREAREAEEAGEELTICGIGWSRGGFTLELMRDWLEQQSAAGTMRVHRLHLNLIDTVMGGPVDRARHLLTNYCNHRPPMHVVVNNYFSNTGNLNLWENLKHYVPQKYQLNMPFFSAVVSNNGNRSYWLDGVEYHHQTTSWLFPATHESLVGRSRNHTEKLAGDIVLADIIRHLEQLRFELNTEWKDHALQRGQEALQRLREINSSFEHSRKYLDLHQFDTTLFGREASEKDNFHSFGGITDFIP